MEDKSLLNYLINENIDPVDYVSYRQKLMDAITERDEYEVTGKNDDFYDEQLMIYIDNIEEIKRLSEDIETGWRKAYGINYDAVDMSKELEVIKLYIKENN